jgi:hypothetical protein
MAISPVSMQDMTTSKGPFTAGVSYGKTQYGYNIAKTKGGDLTNWQDRRHVRLRRRQALGVVFE